MAGDSPDRDRPRITRRRGACSHCRRKKIRCNGGRPCRLCQRHGIECTYLSPASDTSSSDRRLSNATRWDDSQQQSRQQPRDQHRQPQNRSECEPVCTNGHLSGQIHDLDSTDWFLSLATPSSGSLENLTEDLLLSPTAPVASPPLQYDLCAIDPLLEAVVLASPMDHPNTTNGAEEQTKPQGVPAIGVGPAAAATPSMQLVPRTSTHGPPRPSLVDGIGMDSMELNLNLDMPCRTQTSFTLNNDGTSSAAAGPEHGHRNRSGSTGTRKQLLFPALSLLDLAGFGERSLAHFDPCISPFLSVLSKAKVDTALREIAAEVIQYVLSQECQRSLPASWWTTIIRQPVISTSLSSLPLETIISKCFEQPLGVRLYLSQEDALAAAKVFVSPYAQASGLDTCLVTALVAWGSLLKTDTPQSERVHLLGLMLEAYDALNHEPDSPKKLLAMVAVLQLTNNLGLRMLPKLLATIISMIQSLSFHSETALQSICASSPGLAMRVKRACWVVYCVDKINTLRWKSFSLFPERCLQYSPPPMNECDDDWLLVQWRYAQICVRIHEEVSNLRYNKHQSRRDTANIAADLQKWYESLPGNKYSGAETGASRALIVSMRYQFHEASLALLDIDEEPEETARYMSARQRTISIVKDIFSLCNRIELEDIVLDRIYFFLPSLSLCKVVTEVLLHGTSGFEDARTVLAVAHGYFARMKSMLPTHDFFNQVTELVDVAVEAHKSVL